MTNEEKIRALLMCIRRGLIMILGGIEDYLGLQRSIVPRSHRGLPPQTEVWRLDKSGKS